MWNIESYIGSERISGANHQDAADKILMNPIFQEFLRLLQRRTPKELTRCDYFNAIDILNWKFN